MSQYVGKVLIYGASGALGKECVRHFKQAQWLTIGVGTSMDDSMAEKKIQINKKDKIQDQEATVTKQLFNILGENERLDALITTAGGWQGGKINNSEFLSSVANLIESNLNPACVSAAVASKFLKTNGLLIFFGASAALGPTPDMIAYGMIKSAIHQLVRSLGTKNGQNGLNKDVCSIAVLPAILDTPDNRKWLKNMDATTFTPLGFLAESFEKWAKNIERPPNGTLLKLVTVNKETTFETI